MALAVTTFAEKVESSDFPMEEKKIECNELVPWYPSCAGYGWGTPFLSSSTWISEEGTPSTTREREEK